MIAGGSASPDERGRDFGELGSEKAWLTTKMAVASNNDDDTTTTTNNNNDNDDKLNDNGNNHNDNNKFMGGSQFALAAVRESRT